MEDVGGHMCQEGGRRKASHHACVHQNQFQPTLAREAKAELGNRTRVLYRGKGKEMKGKALSGRTFCLFGLAGNPLVSPTSCNFWEGGDVVLDRNGYPHFEDPLCS